LKHPGHIPISEYDYPLPTGRIAQYPLENRDDSKLLIYKEGRITEDAFRSLATYLPSESHIYFNQTKVIPARLFFKKPSGAQIEIFCLEPAGEIKDYSAALLEGPGCRWKCLIGNAKRWRTATVCAGTEGPQGTVTLEAEKTGEFPGYFEVAFHWTPGPFSFSEILELFGNIPLPPYIRRDAEECDKARYQTIFARDKGSIAAPTAGLHFTPAVLDSLSIKNISASFINLHVGAGTFKPVTTELISGHAMHSEFISISIEVLKDIVSHPERIRILIGTTTVRAMESLYWQGIKWKDKTPVSADLNVKQWDPYTYLDSQMISVAEAFQVVINHLEASNKSYISGYTSLMIAPGYTYQVADILITNFHMPKSTLLLLVSAFIGDDWKKAYHFALERDFRFLSYGDSCLFFKS
jgi:S-adenosylmethionine:tRNA ribosyltransferase-isomerase